MSELTSDIGDWLSGPRLWTLVRALTTLVVGFVVARLASAAVVRTMSRLQTPQQMALTRRITSWGLFAVAVMMAIRQLGFDITALLGAAGVLTVAIGFASQTTASNMISGLFLASERGFEIGAASLEEAAEGLGLTPWQRTFKISFPLILPALTFAALLVAVLAIFSLQSCGFARRRTRRAAAAPRQRGQRLHPQHVAHQVAVRTCAECLQLCR